MKHIQQRNSIKLIRELKTTLFNRNTETHRPRYFNHCFQHSLKLRYMQALALMFKLDPVWDDRLITGILNENNQPNVTFINELIIAETIQTDHLLSLLSKVKFFQLFNIDFKNLPNENEKLIEFFLLFTNTIACRSMATKDFIHSLSFHFTFA